MRNNTQSNDTCCQCGGKCPCRAAADSPLASAEQSDAPEVSLPQASDSSLWVQAGETRVLLP